MPGIRQYKNEGLTCLVEGCERSAKTRLMCGTHYGRWLRGEPTGGPIPDTPIKRFFAKVTVDSSGCWIWNGATGGEGYGRTTVNGRAEQAHRFTYRMAFGDCPPGLELDHLCRVRLCVHPLHLEAVTHRENCLRGVSFAVANAAKTHCIRGHEYTPENTRLGAKGGRWCRQCERERRQRPLPAAMVHGRPSSYSNGCRCEPCRLAANAYEREKRRRKAAA